MKKINNATAIVVALCICIVFIKQIFGLETELTSLIKMINILIVTKLFDWIDKMID